MELAKSFIQCIPLGDPSVEMDKDSVLLSW